MSINRGKLKIQASGKEINMNVNRLFTLVIVIALIAIVALTVREAVATSSVVSEMDSATRSYIGWAEAVESERNAIDSATHSYIAWAKAVQAGHIPVTGVSK
jgi:hypothetical protein